MKKNSNLLPLVSVFMPVFNAATYVEKAVLSIQQQTYTQWELVIVDDLSTDGTWEILKKLARKDNKVKIYRNGKHRGVSGAANLGLPMCQGRYIARMDSDDIALPTRLAKQVKFLEKHTDVIAVGTQCQLINADGKTIGSKHFPTEPRQIRDMMFSSIPVQQPSMMIDTSMLPKNFVWYQETLNTAEEVELLFKLFKYGEVANLPEALLQYRIHSNNTSLKNPKKTFYFTAVARLNAVLLYGYKPTFKGVLISLAQLVVVSILPSKFIYPLYSWLRGLKKVSFAIFQRRSLPAISYNC